MFGDIGKIMKIAGQMKTRLPEVQEQIANSRHKAAVGGGVVSATVSGTLELMEIKIDKSLLEEGDVEILEDLVKAAVSTAQQTAASQAKEAMDEITGGMDLGGLAGLLGK